MSPLEEKSLNTQLGLYADIISGIDQIHYDINSLSTSLFKALHGCEKVTNEADKDKPTVTIPKPVYDLLWDKLQDLATREKWAKLSRLSSEKMHEIDIKQKIIKSLKAS